jgi:hypothetical protein
LAQVSGENAAAIPQKANTPLSVSLVPLATANSLTSGGQSGGAAKRTSLEIITPRAQAHIDYALNLAQRGAVESAQAEFRTALELVADALDADAGDVARSHARAVKAGLTAIEEAKEFVGTDSTYDLDTNLSQFASIHRTPVLREPGGAKLTRATALQRYHMYATEQLSQTPRVLVDGAHNAASIDAMMRAIGQHVPYDSMVVIFGCCGDKDIPGMLERITSGADKVIFTKVDSVRTADPNELAARYIELYGKMAQVAPTLKDALEIANRAVTKEDLICITGSFYLVGEAKKLFTANAAKTA